MAASSLEQRKAVERVTTDAALAEALATELARALQLPGTNRTLGRTFVRFGLAALREGDGDADVERLFLTKARTLASIRPELASALLHRVKERLRNATLQVAAERDEAKASAAGGAAPIAGFSGATRVTLGGDRGAGAGGVVKPARDAPTFRRPSAALRAVTKLHGTFKVPFLCAQRRAGVLLNISAKFWRARTDERSGAAQAALGLEALAKQKRAARAAAADGVGGGGGGGGAEPVSKQGGGAKRPKRSGLGVDSEAWERPVRLDSSATTATETFWNRGASADATTQPYATPRPSPAPDAPTPATPGWRDHAAGGASPTKPDEAARRQDAAAAAADDDDDDDVSEDSWERAAPKRAAKAAADDDFDRRYYDDDGAAAAATDAAFVGDEEKWAARENEMARQRAKGEGNEKLAGMSARRSQLPQDQAAWEENRLLTSGVASPSAARTNHRN